MLASYLESNTYPIITDLGSPFNLIVLVTSSVPIDQFVDEKVPSDNESQN